MAKSKTYSHLLGEQPPAEYDIVTKNLHYYIHQGISTKLSVNEWYEKHQEAALITNEQWNQFSDPEQMTYRKFVDWQKDKEKNIESTMSETMHLLDLELIIPPARFLFHGLQMISAYIGSMAPSGQLTVMALLQATQEMSRLQRYSYYMAYRRKEKPDFGVEARQVWEKHKSWQPLRSNLERLMVTYDWIEALIGLNLVLKPQLDELFINYLAQVAETYGDKGTADFCKAFEADSQWQQRWSHEFIKFLSTKSPDFILRAENTKQKWFTITGTAIKDLKKIFPNCKTNSVPEAEIV